jgi:hypothetical protein
MKRWQVAMLHTMPQNKLLLVYLSNRDIYVAQLRGTNWIDVYEEPIAEEGFAQVTHWMHLPDPPT